jgi:hypothetical protein
MSLNKPHNPIYPRFIIEDYEQHPQAVKKVNDAALEYLETVQAIIEQKDILINQKDAEIAQLRSLDLFSLVQPIGLLIGATIFGFGVNIATSHPHELFGWLLSFAGCGIQLVIISIGVIARLRR